MFCEIATQHTFSQRNIGNLPKGRKVERIDFLEERTNPRYAKTYHGIRRKDRTTEKPPIPKIMRPKF
jgi:hypothetical protein